MALAGRVADLVRPTVEAMGYALVRVQLLGHRKPRLQIMAERQDGRLMRIEDCAELSRALSAVLDVEDPVRGTYTLEVSSPGIDRPLVALADFDRFAGFEARIEMGRPIDGPRRFQGLLLGTAGEIVRIKIGDAEAALPYADVQRAKLVLTDRLLAATEQDSR